MVELSILQGWTANTDGVVDQAGAIGDITLNPNTMVATPTTAMTLDGNLPADAGTPSFDRVVKVYDSVGAASDLTLTFVQQPGGWGVSTDGGATIADSMSFTDGRLTSSGTLTVGGKTIDVSQVSSFAGMSSLTVASQNGSAVGKLESFTLGNDGSLIGSFSNGTKQVLAKIALAKFTNPAGLEKAGGSSYVATANSGNVQLGAAGDPGIGTLAGGSLEMSNVDLSQEFTNLIVAQRGFQANARIITTSDEVLQELGNLKR